MTASWPGRKLGVAEDLAEDGAAASRAGRVSRTGRESRGGRARTWAESRTFEREGPSERPVPDPGSASSWRNVAEISRLLPCQHAGGTAVSIRAATEDDLAAILRIYNDAIVTGVATWDEEPWTMAQRRAWWDGHDETQPVLVAEVEGEVAGFAYLTKMSAKSGWRFTREDTIYLDERFQGRGSVACCCRRSWIARERARPAADRGVDHLGEHGQRGPAREARVQRGRDVGQRRVQVRALARHDVHADRPAGVGPGHFNLGAMRLYISVTKPWVNEFSPTDSMYFPTRTTEVPSSLNASSPKLGIGVPFR